MKIAASHPITPKLVDALYTEAMVLADEARSYFDSDRARCITPAAASVAFSCESLKVTTRLMHVIAWLLNQKAIRAGEIALADIASLEQIGYAPATDTYWLNELPIEACTLILASEDLYYRVHRISESIMRAPTALPEPLVMIERIRAAF
jgi:regulator of CtrA degradation